MSQPKQRRRRRTRQQRRWIKKYAKPISSIVVKPESYSEWHLEKMLNGHEILVGTYHGPGEAKAYIAPKGSPFNP
jgi:hypothetical protein